MTTCGGCLHYRGSRCINRSASTYQTPFPADSRGCQMHLTKILLPIDIGLKLLMFIIIPISLVIGVLVGRKIEIPDSDNTKGFNI